MSAGTCRGCGCDEQHPCARGCGWTDETRTFCTECTPAAEVARVLLEAVRAAPSLLVDPPEAPAPLVLACRAVLEQFRDQLLQMVGIEAADAAIDVGRLAQVLDERFPAEVEAAIERQEGIVDLAIRLLTQEPARRIVLPHEVM